MQSTTPARRAIPRFVTTTLALLCAACTHSPSPADPDPDSAPMGESHVEPVGASSTPLPVHNVPATPSESATDRDRFESRVKAAELRVSEFFAAPFPKPYEVTIFPHRADFDAFASKAWGVPRTECWMVAAGVADRFVVLAPQVWQSEACEHDDRDVAHVDGILTHELTHVFHGQMNPTGDFTGMDPLGWFVEGLAVVASGQIAAEHAGKDREAIAAGAVPKDLESFWSGKYRYGISGSLVRYIDMHYGRATLLRLLPATTNHDALEILKTTEPELIAAWIESVGSAKE